ncbi:MAG: hypothetical protein K2W96_24225 [Gemmataceae bacterium]|nr:hypothetical protein [Gemmataceae bacterium]
MRACSALLLLASLAQAQPDTLPLLPVPVPPGPPPLVAPPPPPPPPGPFLPAPLPPPTPDGFFANVELAIVLPRIEGKLAGPVGVPPAKLDAAVSPTFEIGYKPGGAEGGYFALALRFLDASGGGDPRSRLSAMTFDLDYGQLPVEFAPRWTFGWRVGARIADLSFDSRDGLGQRSRNEFYGGGVHGRADFERRIVPVPGLSLFGRLDGAVVVGHVVQRYSVDGFTVWDRDSRAVPMVNAQAGLSYVPPLLPALKVTAGYEYERWFKVGSLGLTATGTLAGSSGDVWWHGVFLRGQFDF